ncbi:MAG: DedA family protein [Bacteroidales bacterium]|nr:DedA family protein [Bacteroidales bacterium]
MDLAQYGLIGLFIGTFLAATVLPFSSDALYIAVLAATSNAAGCLLYGTLGNWLGSVFTYFIGRIGRWDWMEKLFKVKPETLEKQKRYVDKYGVWLGLACWVPIVGDVFALVMGFYRAPMFWTFLMMLIGKFGRFLIWTLLIL